MSTEIFSLEDMLNLQNTLRKDKKTLTCAESCTGGLIASMITSVSGSSDVFLGSVVTYSNEVKIKEVAVSKENITEYGAVSEAVVADMCRGVLEKFDADYSIGVSGVAGPNGGSKEKPVGTVVIGVLKRGDEPIVSRELFSGNRVQVQKISAQYALKKLSTIV